MVMTTCAGCRYQRAQGKCGDPCWTPGEQIEQETPRLCYEPRPAKPDPATGIKRMFDETFLVRKTARGGKS